LDVRDVKILQPGIKLRGTEKKDGSEDYCEMMRDGKWDWENLGVYKVNQRHTGSVIDGTLKEIETDEEKK